MVHRNLKQGKPPSTYFLKQRPQLSTKKTSPETLLRLAELVLTFNCFSFGDNCFKQIHGAIMGTKMGPSNANLIVGYIENEFSLTTTGQNLIFTNVSSMTASVLLHPAERNSTNSLLQSILSTRLLSTPGKLFSTSTFQSTATVYLRAYTMNQQIPITICCIRPLIHNT